ncbi:MAG: hypothetical protein VX447_02595 [Pseudomonadota bacterium]|nr:hypothetical protein [Pseudomonadota bacterium]
MFRLLSIFGLLVSYQAWACTCVPLSVDEAKNSADVVFAGIVKNYTLIDSKEEWEPRILLEFNVARVWKGDISGEFTMHTNVEGSSCGGFFREFLKPGTNLIVYGFGREAKNWKNNHIDGAPNANSLSVIGDRKKIKNHKSIDELTDKEIVYTTNICTRTGLVLYAVDDFKELGEFKEYRKLDVKPDPIALDAITWKQNSLPDECGELGNARRWEVINKPPINSMELISLLEDGSMYKSIPKPRITKYKDYWVSDENGNYGLCRRSVDPEIVCGQATIEYSLVSADGEPKQKQWKVASGGVQTYCKLRE